MTRQMTLCVVLCTFCTVDSVLHKTVTPKSRVKATLYPGHLCVSLSSVLCSVWLIR